MKKSKAFLLGAVTMLAMALSNQANAQSCSDVCLSNTMSLNTGYDYTTSTAYSPGQNDEWWQVVQVPTADAAAPIAPFCAYVINNDPSWSPNFPPNPTGSMWINVYPTTVNNFNNWTGGICGAAQGNPYRFEKKFNVCSNSVPGPYSCTLHLEMMADDLVDKVWVDGTVVKDLSTYLCVVPTPRPFTYAGREQFTITISLAAGAHTIDVDMRNIGGKFSGINMQGSITSQYTIFDKETCYGQNTCSSPSNESDCFHSADLSIVYDNTDPSNNCNFTATVTVVPTTGSKVKDYVWTYPVLPSGYGGGTSSSNTVNFTVPDGGAHDVLSVIINGIDSRGYPCGLYLSDENMGCNGGHPVQKIPQASGANSNNASTDKSIIIYPNPTNDYVTVEAKTGTINHIQVYDITGKIMADNRYNNVASQKISLASYAAGTYVIKVNDGTTQIINKVK